MEVRMRVHAFDPSMTEELYLWHPHLVLEEMELAHGLIGITRVAGITAIPSQGGDSHVHIVKPDGVVMRTVAGIGAIKQTIFLVDDEVHISCNQRIVGLRLLSLHLQTDERGCHRATVIEGCRTQHAAHLGVKLRVGSQLVGNLGSQFGKHIGTIGDKSQVSLVACCFIGGKGRRIGYATFIASETETTANESQRIVILGRHAFADIAKHTIHHRLDIGRLRNAIGRVIVGLHKVQRRVGVVYLFRGHRGFLILCRVGASREQQYRHCNSET